MNIAHHVERAAKLWPEKPALYFENQFFSYRQLDELSNRVTNGLSSLGIDSSARVALLLPNHPAFVISYLGTLKLGAIAVTINTALKAEELQFILNDSGAQVLITTADLRTNLPVADQLQNILPHLRHILIAEGDAGDAPTLQELLTQAAPVAHSAPLAPDAPAVILYTSGTTGFPKGALLSHSNIAASTQAAVVAFDIRTEDCGLLCLPAFHSYGQTAAIHPCFEAGATLVLHRQFAAAPVLQSIQDQAVTHFFGVPTLYLLLYEQANPSQLATVRRYISGGATLPVTLAQQWQQKYGRAINEGYGSSETSKSTLNQTPQAKPGSVGTPLDGVTLRIVNEAGELASSGTLGEVWIQGANVMRGYWQRPTETAAALQDGWFHTGDIGWVDTDGYFYIVDRIKDMINVGGAKVYCSEVEQVLCQHPAVQEAAVYGIPEPLLGEQVCAAVVLKPHATVTPAALLAFCQVRLAEFKTPTQLDIVAELPKGRSGKILKRILRENRQLAQATVAQSAPDVQATSAPFAVPPPNNLLPSANAVASWLSDWLAQALALPSAEIDVNCPFAEYGLTSVLAVQLAQALSHWLQHPIDAVITWRYPTITTLAHYISHQLASPSPSTDTTNRSDPTSLLSEPIAIIGLGCRFPGGVRTPAAFWQLLHDGIDAVTAIPATRWRPQHYYAPDPAVAGKLYIQAGAFLDDIDQFDPQFFGISPREAVSLDPQQRLLLETSWEALENAGIAPDTLNGSQTGVFIGAFWDDYSAQRFYAVNPSELDSYRLLSNLRGLMAGRIAYVLDLHGPTMQLDTSCSSSLLAVHQACQSLRMGECDLALAGGVSLMLSPEQTIALSRTGAVAADGRSKTFDATADGFGRGEGCGVVVLKRLRDALRDKDAIVAVVRGSAVNHDGRSNGLTVPNGLAQEAVIRQALTNAGVAAQQIQYVETHGTGTVLGDPIEVLALATVLRRDDATPLAIGSVKTNIGHLDAAAGIVGLMKTALALQHGEIPPHLHFNEPNPYIPWATLPLTVPTQPTPWPTPAGEPRRAGVSAFGMSGTNVHVILEQAPEDLRLHSAELPIASASTKPPSKIQHAKSPERTLHLLTLRAKTPAALFELAQRYTQFLSTHPESMLADICYTANTGRAQFSYRLAVVGATPAQMESQLVAWGKGMSRISLMSGQAPIQGQPKVAFLFTGQGAQYVGMGRELYATQPLFRAIINRCDEVLCPLLGESILPVLYPTLEMGSEENQAAAQAQSPNAKSKIYETTYTQPVLFALEYALAALWQSWGVQPDLLIGHSVGELVAACVAGVFSLEDGLKLIAARSRLMGALAQDGEMVSLLVNEAFARNAIASYKDEIALAAINGPESVVISGKRETMQAVTEQLAAAGVETHQLAVSHAFHSPLMEPMLVEFGNLAATITYHPPKIRLVSNVTGKIAGQEIAAPDYWVRHVRDTVRFAEGIQTLHEQGCTLFLEIGPKPVLLGLMQLHDKIPPQGVSANYAKQVNGVSLESRKSTSKNLLLLPSLHPGKADEQQMLESLSAMYVQGLTIDWKGFDHDYLRRKVMLPTYPFQRQRYWIDFPTTISPTKRKDQGGQRMLLDRQFKLPTQQQMIFETMFCVETLPFLADHRVFGEVVAPGACHLAMLLNASETMWPGHAYQLANIVFTQPLVIDENAERTVQLIFTPVSLDNHESGKAFQLLSFMAVDNEAEPSTVTHVTGQVGRSKLAAAPFPQLDKVRQQGTEALADELFDTNLLAQQITLGPQFRWLAKIWRVGSREQPAGLGLVRLPEGVSDLHGYLLHPGLLDACFQLTNIGVLGENIHQTLLPFAVDSLRLYRAAQGHQWWCYAQQIAEHQWDLYLWDEQGQPLAELTGFMVRPTQVEDWRQLLANASAKQMEVARHRWLYELAWHAQDCPSAAPQPSAAISGIWLIFADQPGVGSALAERLRAKGGVPLLVYPGAQYQQATDHWQIRPLVLEDIQKLLQTIQATTQPLRSVVHLWSLTDPADLSDLSSSAEWLEQAQAHSCGSTLLLVQALAEVGLSPNLWLVTQGATRLLLEQNVANVGQIAPTPLWGLGGVIAAEHPELRCMRVDVEPADPTATAHTLLQTFIAANEQEAQIAYWQGRRHVARLQRLTLPDKQISAETPARPQVQPNASYLITGGLGGLGLKTAQWLVDQGAQSLVLMSRHQELSAAEQAKIAEMEKHGGRVHVMQGDVAKVTDVARVLQTIEQTCPPLRGIIHAAGVLDDAVLTQQSWERFTRVMAPKIKGTWHLHCLTQTLPLDFFVCFSSAAALLGPPGQGNYAAANAFMDALCHYRRQQGLPALSINWGAWSEVGLAAAFIPQLALQGIGSIPPDVGVQLFADLLRSNASQVAALPMDWVKFQQQNAHGSYLFAALLDAQLQTKEAHPAPRHWLAQWHSTLPEVRLELLLEYLQNQVTQILHLPNDDQLDRSESFLRLGFDSLMAVELRNLIIRQLGVNLPLSKILTNSSVEQVARFLNTELLTTAIPMPAVHEAMMAETARADDLAPSPSSYDSVERITLVL